MSKTKYSEELKSLIVKMRLDGKTIPEIEAATGMGRSSQQKLYRERRITLTPEQLLAATTGSRWKGHQPIVDGKKHCATCNQMKAIEDFHVSKKRMTGLTSKCKDCYRISYEADTETVKARVRKYREKNKEKIAKGHKQYYENNADLMIERAAKWVAANPEKRKVISRSYGKRNQKAKNGRTAHYRAKKIQATPPWLTEIDLAAIAALYQMCPKGYHVDHIVPLRSDDVCGLHVPWNLQLLPGVENMSKGNKILPHKAKDPKKAE